MHNLAINHAHLFGGPVKRVFDNPLKHTSEETLQLSEKKLWKYLVRVMLYHTRMGHIRPTDIAPIMRTLKRCFRELYRSNRGKEILAKPYIVFPALCAAVRYFIESRENRKILDEIEKPSAGPGIFDLKVRRGQQIYAQRRRYLTGDRNRIVGEGMACARAYFVDVFEEDPRKYALETHIEAYFIRFTEPDGEFRPFALE